MFNVGIILTNLKFWLDIQVVNEADFNQKMYHLPFFFFHSNLGFHSFL